jgi:hypothetical protein
VRYHNARSGYRQRSKTQLIQMQKIRTSVANDFAEIILGGVEILLAFLHPVEAKGCGMIFEAVQSIHPRGLMRKRNFAEADERDVCTVGHETGNQFARVRPNSAERVSRHQYAHGTPGDSRAGKTLGMLATSLVATTAGGEELSSLAREYCCTWPLCVYDGRHRAGDEKECDPSVAGGWEIPPFEVHERWGTWRLGNNNKNKSNGSGQECPLHMKRRFFRSSPPTASFL